MSHSITMNTSAFYASKASSISIYWTLPVIIKFIQVVLGVVCVGIVSYGIVVNFQDLVSLSAVVISQHQLGGLLHHLRRFIRPLIDIDHVFLDQLTCRLAFLIVTIIFTTLSLIQLTWFPASFFAGSIKSRIIFGLFYHSTGFVLHLITSLFLLERIGLLGDKFYNIDIMRTVAHFGLATAVTYLLSTITTLWYFIVDKIYQRGSSLVGDRIHIMERLPK